MICSKPKCQKELPATYYCCKCEAAFCSEACFVSTWHAGHQKECPYSTEITKTMAEKAGGAKGMLKNATKLLASTALVKVCKAGEATPPATATCTPAAVSDEPGNVQVQQDPQLVEKLAALEKANEKFKSEYEEIKESMVEVSAAKDKANSELKDAQSLGEQHLRDAERLEKQLTAMKKEAEANGNVDVKYLEAEVDKLRDKSTDLWRDFAGERALNNDLRDELTDAKKTLRESEDQARRATEKVKVLDEKLEEESEACRKQMTGSEAGELQTALQEYKSECQSMGTKLESLVESGEASTSEARQNEKSLQESLAKLQQALEGMTESESEARREADTAVRKNQRLERDCESFTEQLEAAKEEQARNVDDIFSLRNEESEVRKLLKKTEKGSEEQLQELQEELQQRGAESTRLQEKAEEERQRLVLDMEKIVEDLKLTKEAEERARQMVADGSAAGDAHAALQQEHGNLQQLLKDVKAAEMDAAKLAEERQTESAALEERLNKAQQDLGAKQAEHDGLKESFSKLEEAGRDLQAECQERSDRLADMTASDAKHKALAEELRLKGESLQANCEDLEGKLDILQSLKNKVHEELTKSNEREKELAAVGEQLQEEVEEAKKAESDQDEVAKQAMRLQQKRDSLIDECDELRQSLADAEAAAAAREQEAQEQHSRLKEERDQAHTSLGRAEDEALQAQSALDQSRQARQQLQEDVNEAQQEAAEARAAHSDAAKAADEHRVGVERALKEKEMIVQELQATQEIVSELAAQNQVKDSVEQACEGLRQEMATVRSEHSEAGRSLDDAKWELQQERASCSHWRTLIIAEQDRCNDLQEQLMDAGRARTEALRKEAAKQREVERLQRQLAAVQPGGEVQSSEPPADNGTSALEQEIVRLQSQLDKAVGSEAEELKACQNLQNELKRAEVTREEAAVQTPRPGPTQAEYDALQAQLEAATKTPRPGPTQAEFDALQAQLAAAKMAAQEAKAMQEQGSQESAKQIHEAKSLVEELRQKREAASTPVKEAGEVAPSPSPSPEKKGYNWWWK